MKLRAVLLLFFAAVAYVQKAQADFSDPLFGSNVHVYKPTDNMDSIHADVERIHERLFKQDFSRERYALLFMPGDYREAGLLHIPFYVHVAGLGRTPLEVQVSNIHTPPHLPNGNCTCTFWRSVENLSVIGQATYDEEETFKWSVSQAAPIRRVYSERTVRHQWLKGWVSGGFTADCWFVAPAGSDHQQQWYTRNSRLEQGRGEFREMKYNYVFQGVELGDDVDRSTYTDNWDKGGNVTFLPETPVIREKPFLFVGEDGRYKVFRPALRRKAVGLSWSKDRIGEGDVIDLQSAFYLVEPGTSASEINRQLSAGKHLMFLPGIFVLEEPLRISRPGTIVMGLGWSTIVPGETNPEAAPNVARRPFLPRRRLPPVDCPCGLRVGNRAVGRHRRPLLDLASRSWRAWQCGMERQHSSRGTPCHRRLRDDLRPFQRAFPRVSSPLGRRKRADILLSMRDAIRCSEPGCVHEPRWNGAGLCRL